MNISTIPHCTANDFNRNIKNSSQKNAFDIGTATKQTNSSSDGKRIGLILIGQTAYIATYADSSTPSNPIVKVGDYEINVNEVNPNEATELEMFALMSYMDDTNQTNNKGICSFGKMRAFAELAQYNGMCNGIKNENAIYDKKQNWINIINAAKQIFLGNSATYKQATECENLLFAMSKGL